ncbi:MAG TPA: histidine kinase [Polyangiaceae bacterium]|nr:histidine kinase [Polyangiaceae bacterium]
MKNADREDSSPPSGWRRWLVGVGIVTAVSILQIVPQLFTGRSREHLGLRVGFVTLELLVIMTALSVHYVLAERRKLGSARTVTQSLVISAVLGALCAVGMHAVFPEFPPWKNAPDLPLAAIAGFGATMGLFQCGVWALAFVYPFAAEDARLRSLEAEKLRLEAEQLRAAAELARLRSQLEPHFLLNTLNAIAGLVTQDPREARRLIGCLGDLLRDALRDPEELQTLHEEVSWLKRYAEILESRHSGQLRFRWEISGDAGEVLLPRLLLQPLVENAVKHGALRRSSGGEVVVRARLTPPDGGGPARVVCTVEDNGPGVADEAPRSGAFGLRSVRRRLELRYRDASLRLESSSSGTRSIVDLPCFLSRADVA